MLRALVGCGDNGSIGPDASSRVFSDGVTHQLATVTGDASGYVAMLQVAI